MALRLLSYARYSTEQQSSIADQLAMNAEAAEEHGATVVDTFTDEAVSRSISRRPGLVALLARIEEGGVDGVVVPALDRLIGDLQQHVDLLSRFDTHDLRLFTYDGEANYRDDEYIGQIEQGSVAASAEVRKARKRTRNALRSKNRAGRYTSRPPFGLRMKPLVDPATGQELPAGVSLVVDGKVRRSGEIEVDPDNIEHLRSLFRWAAEDVTPREIAIRLTQAGAVTKNGNTVWRDNSVRDIIRNRIYLGERTWGREGTVHGYSGKRTVTREEGDANMLILDTGLGSVVEPELWQRANDLLTARVSYIKPSAQKKPPRVLDGLVFCGRCGSRMSSRQHSKRLASGERSQSFIFYCQSYRSAAAGGERVMRNGQVRRYCDKAHSIAESKILAALRGELSTAPAAGVHVIYSAEGDAGLTTRLAETKRELSALQGEWRRTVDAHIKYNAFTDAELTQRQAATEQRRAELQELLASLEEQKGEARQTRRAADAAQVLAVGVDALLAAPAAEARAALREGGLVRVEVDAPTVGLIFE